MFCGHICLASECLLVALYFLATYGCPWPYPEKLGDASCLPLTKQLLTSYLLIWRSKFSFTVTIAFCMHVCCVWEVTGRHVCAYVWEAKVPWMSSLIAFHLLH